MPDDITIERDRDRWRLTCPRGHRSWQPSSGGWYCRRCHANGLDAYHEQLRDEKTGDPVSREEVHL